MSECPSCGAVVDDKASVCPSCGARLEGVTESFPPIETEPLEGGAHVELLEGPVLVVRKGAEVGERFFIDRPRLTVGRDPGSDIFLNDITVSRAHAVIESAAGEVKVTDAGSLNGTFVNGMLVDSAYLQSGDIVQIGRFQMLFLRGGERG